MSNFPHIVSLRYKDATSIRTIDLFYLHDNQISNVTALIFIVVYNPTRSVKALVGES
ncbi:MULTISPECIES: hypothetical protein [Flavobacterium]|uniref:hypothetical protein n=1 Tax=Flavobacterium TaxID=237 RepID=UPI00140546CA|nr:MULTISPECIES: hypothetical protein [Flavobacterium]